MKTIFYLLPIIAVLLVSCHQRLEGIVYVNGAVKDSVIVQFQQDKNLTDNKGYFDFGKFKLSKDSLYHLRFTDSVLDTMIYFTKDSLSKTGWNKFYLKRGEVVPAYKAIVHLDGKPVENMAVVILTLNKSTTTAANGEFVFQEIKFDPKLTYLFKFSKNDFIADTLIVGNNIPTEFNFVSPTAKLPLFSCEPTGGAYQGHWICNYTGNYDITILNLNIGDKSDASICVVGTPNCPWGHFLNAGTGSKKTVTLTAGDNIMVYQVGPGGASGICNINCIDDKKVMFLSTNGFNVTFLFTKK